MNLPGSTVNGLHVAGHDLLAPPEHHLEVGLPGSSARQRTSTMRWGSMVTGAGEGAAIEKNTPVRSMRVAGPATERRSKDSTNRADTMSMSSVYPRPIVMT